MSERKKIEVITRILKRRFSNLSASEIVKLSYDILEAVEEVNQAESNENNKANKENKNEN